MLVAWPGVYTSKVLPVRVPRKAKTREPGELGVVGINSEALTLVNSKSTSTLPPTPKSVRADTCSMMGVGDAETGKVKLESSTKLPTPRNPGGCSSVQPPPAMPQKLFGWPKYGSTNEVTRNPGKLLQRKRSRCAVYIASVNGIRSWSAVAERSVCRHWGGIGRCSNQCSRKTGCPE